MKPNEFFKKLQSKLPELKKDLIATLEVEAENFVLNNFARAEFQDTSPQRWPKRQHEEIPAYAPLVRSGDLRRAASNAKPTSTGIKFIMNQPYAQLHNEGGTVTITAKMRRFFWAKYFETKEDYWKNLALTKKTKLRIPKRKFIGQSQVLNMKFKTQATLTIIKFLNTL